MSKKSKMKGSSTHGPRQRSVPRPTGKMKSNQSTSTHSQEMRIVQQGPGR